MTPTANTSSVCSDGLSRRALLTTGAALSMTLAAGCSTEPTGLDETAAVALLTTLGDIAIPTTDTTGAGGIETAKWVYGALARGMRDGSMETLSSLQAELDAGVPNKAFARASRPQQVAAVKTLDDALKPGRGVELTPWATVKSLILRAYYTSEVGASQELRYELVPGRFDPDLPITPGERAWSTDANARNHGS